MVSSDKVPNLPQFDGGSNKLRLVNSSGPMTRCEFGLLVGEKEKDKSTPDRGPGCWAATNRGVTNRGLRGVWPPFLEIGLFHPFSPLFALYRRAREHPEIQKKEENGLFLRISSDFLKPPSLETPFVALQGWGL